MKAPPSHPLLNAAAGDQTPQPARDEPQASAPSLSTNNSTTATAAVTTIILASTTTTTTTTPPISIKKQALSPTPVTTQQIQQAPLALTTQSTSRTTSTQNLIPPVPLSNSSPIISVSTAITNSVSPTPTTLAQNVLAEQQVMTPAAAMLATNPAGPQTQISQLQQQPNKPQPILISSTSAATPVITAAHQTTAQQIGIANATPQAGPTALVIIPQHPNASLGSTASQSTVVSKTATIGGGPTAAMSVTTAHVPNLTQVTQPIQLTAPPTTTQVTNTASAIPMTAHQQATIGQSTVSTLAITPARAPTSISAQPKSVAASVVKSEQPYICCLLDNGVRCDSIAGNSSFSARIQKVVSTKKLNFSLDPTVRHTFLCDQHKAILTVAKKSTVARESKTARSHNAAHNNQSAPNQQTNSNFNDLSARQAIQHPVSMDTLNNQNNLAHNHTGIMNNVAVRQGNQITYGHYQSAHPNQHGNMDVIMSSSFDHAGGDTLVPRGSGADVDLQQLQVNTLRRYKKHFRVQTRPGLNKMQLAEVLKCHFRTLPIIEKEAITYFVYIVKCYRNKLDQSPKAE